jgi:hypothetical protein
MFSREKNSFIRSTMSAGYLIRTAEESFGERPTIQDEEIARLLSHREKAHLDRLCDATNALDMRCRTYELSGLEAKLFVNRTVVEPFEGMVAALASRWYPDLGCSGLLQFRKRKIAREWTFRNAVWGYLFRAVEASAWV